MTVWHHEDDQCWVADCEVCSVPMVVWWDHGPDCGPEARARLLAALTASADERFGSGHWWLDTTMRQVPEHFHAHARDGGWYRDRFSRPMSRYTAVGGDRHELPTAGGGGGA